MKQFELDQKMKSPKELKGFHIDQLIYGAPEVGSEFKIDCSYLSPNVSIATSIERSTDGRA